MKKTFTLVAVALCAMSLNAQTESWTVNDGEALKADYVANADATQMSVVGFSTANVKGTHTSGPVAGYTDGPLVEGKLEVKNDNSWGNLSKRDLSSDGSVAPFYYVQGKGNPVDIDKVTFEEVVTDDVPTGNFRAYWNDAYYLPDGTAGLPTNGTYVTLTPAVDGTMKAAIWVNKGNRDVYVVKGSDAKALSFGTDITVTGYINGQNWDVADDSPLKGYMMYQETIPVKGTEGTDAYVIGQGNQACFVYLTFNVVANETYYLLCKSTQIGFGGYEFTPAGGTGISNVNVDADANANAPIFNLAGQRVTKATKGILIRNGKKFINK